MVVSVVALVVAALCSGAAAVCQASAVARSARQDLTGLLGGLVREPRYLLGTALVGAGFLASLVAVRELPLFLVQAGRASSLGVTAVLAALLLGSRLHRREVLALAGVAAGLVAVALAAAPRAAGLVDPDVRWSALAGAITLLAAVVVCTRVPATPTGSVLVAALAGSCFAVVSLGARVLGPVTVPGVLADPSAWAIGLSGVAGLVAGALALQRGSVVLVTTTMVATESVLGSVLGVLVGDRPAEGLGGLAVAGFAVTIGSALLLARFGAVPAPAVADGQLPAGEDVFAVDQDVPAPRH
ncbi:hypothetical protein ASG41_00940 [Modestobacter sp. Leaf380]|nr:hypothetical protein ASG41_00940 [Modestobacter sp. Leaf380]